LVRIYNSRCLIFIFYAIHFCGIAIVHAQSYHTTFGIVSELKSAKNAFGLLVGDFNGDKYEDLASYGGKQIHINFQTKKNLSWRSTSVYIDLPIARAVEGDCNHDRYSDIIILTDSIRHIEVLIGKPREKFHLSWKNKVEGFYDHFIAADLNNDKRTDILLFGKKELGISVYLGKGNGTFVRDTVLLPEYSYSALLVTDINSDNISDLIATNWVSNSLLVYTGFGQMRFSDPVELSFSYEPWQFHIVDVNADNIKDIVATFPDDPSIQILNGDGLGNYPVHQIIRRDRMFTNVSVKDINGDGRNDICLLDKHATSMSIYLNNGSGNMGEQIVYYAGKLPTDLAFVHYSKAKYVSAAILDQSSPRIRLLHNALLPPARQTENTFATGLQPSDVVVKDINNDGWNDIIVAHSGSNEISVFFNHDSGLFYGQIPFLNTSVSNTLKHITYRDSTAIFLGSNSEANNISIMEINLSDYSSKSFSLPTEGQPEILYSSIDSLSGNLEIISLEHHSGKQNVSLVAYEQVAPARFVERDITPKINTPLFNAVILNSNQDAFLDIIFTAYDEKRKKEHIFFSSGGANYRFNEPQLFWTFESPEVVQANIWTAYINHDGYSDVIINLLQPENSLMFFLGSKDAIKDQPAYTIKRSVNITKTENLQVIDVNNDGLSDLVFQNDIRKAIQLYFGKRNGSFSPPIRLAASEGLGSFELGDVDGDNVPELILTDKIQGTFKIISLEDK